MIHGRGPAWQDNTPIRWEWIQYPAHKSALWTGERGSHGSAAYGKIQPRRGNFHTYLKLWGSLRSPGLPHPWEGAHSQTSGGIYSQKGSEFPFWLFPFQGHVHSGFRKYTGGCFQTDSQSGHSGYCIPCTGPWRWYILRK